MSFEYFDRYFTFAAAGLGVVLAGGLNLALGQSGRRIRLRIVLSLAVCVAVAAGLAAITRPGLGLQTLALQFGVLALAGLAGSSGVARRAASLMTALRKPAIRWGLVTAGGLGVILAMGLAFDRADEIAADEGLKHLESEVSRRPTKPSERSRASTDRGNPIVLKEPIEYRNEGELNGPEERLLLNSPYRDQLIRRSAATDHSNCHGWVFTGGRFLLAPDDVEAIVKENGYHETHEPHPGDLVVYRQEKAIAHTAIVRYVSEGQPVLVEGKWGLLGVFLHPADKSHYGTDYTFYRSTRAGHLLVGVGGTSSDPAVAASATSE